MTVADSFADSFATETEGAEPAASSAGASWGQKSGPANQEGSAASTASATWESASTARDDSASVSSWNVPAQSSDSTESVAGSSFAESDSGAQLGQADDAETLEKSYDSGHGESRIEQGVKAVRISVPEEGGPVPREGADSTEKAEGPLLQKSDDDWIKELLESTPIAEQRRVEEDTLAFRAGSAKKQVDDGNESERGSGAVTPVAARPRSPVSYADIA